MSNTTEPRPTHTAGDVAAGTFVAASLEGRRTLCLKVERIGRDHVNHFLVPLDPLPDRTALALVYADPDTPVVVVEGVSLAFDERDGDGAPQVGDAFSTPAGPVLKVVDRPLSQRMHAYVEIATGLLRPRMERRQGRLLQWSVQRI